MMTAGEHGGRAGSQAAERFVRAARVEELDDDCCTVASVDGHTLALVRHGGQVYAVDNACPHMGFPLHRGSVEDGILTCHWHHARFDLASGGTFDPWADDVRAYPAEIRDGEVWVNLAPRRDPVAHQQQRLADGLEQNLSLVIAKAVLTLLSGEDDPTVVLRRGLEFGTRYRAAGWGQGLTILACMANLYGHLDAQDRPRAIYHGLTAVAGNTVGSAPRFGLDPLPGPPREQPTLARWFRQFVEVRDGDGAERCLVSAVRGGAAPEELAAMLFAAATDHRFLDGGHLLDFTNKALESLDRAGWELAEPVLASLAQSYAGASRMEESNAWRRPIDAVAVLDDAFDEIGPALVAGRPQRGSWRGQQALSRQLLEAEPAGQAEALLDALAHGATEAELGSAVARAAALRIARFHTSNEFSDWDTALHSFTFIHAVHQGLRRVPSELLLRGLFDGAVTIYLTRFLNVPPARIPDPDDADESLPADLLAALPALLDRQQQVNQAASLVARYLDGGGDEARLMAVLGGLLLREDRNFHTIQMLEAAFAQRQLAASAQHRRELLTAAARYLAAHAPTMRSQGQTYLIARRLARGERLYENGDNMA